MVKAVEVIRTDGYQLPGLVLIDGRGKVFFAGENVFAVGQLLIDLGGASPYPVAARALHSTVDKANVVSGPIGFCEAIAVYNRLASFGQVAKDFHLVGDAVDFQRARQARRQNLARGERVAEQAGFA